MATRKDTKYLVVHCSATRPSQDIGADTIRGWHVKERGFSDIGYHLVIRRSGVIELARPLSDIGAHVLGHNTHSVGICLVGGVTEDDVNVAEDNFTPEQMRSLDLVLDFLLLIYPLAEVVGHRDLSPDIDGDGVVEQHEWLKFCPSFDAPQWWRQRGLRP